MFSKKFWVDTLERVIGTFAATVVGSGATFDFTNKLIWLASGVAAAFTFFKCLAATQVGDPESPSMAKVTLGDVGYTLVDVLICIVLVVLVLLVVGVIHIH